MDYELYDKIKKGNLRTLRGLQESELPWAYFVCYRMTGDVHAAAELLRKAWIETVSRITTLGGCPKDSFRACLARELYRLCDTLLKIEDDGLFSDLEEPRIAQKFDLFIEEIDRLKPKERSIYLLNKLGELGNVQFSEILKISLREAKEYLYTLENKAHPRENKNACLELIQLSGEFKSANKLLFEQITIPDMFISVLEHDYNKIFNVAVTYGKNTKRKDSNMKPTAKNTGKSTVKPKQSSRRAASNKKKKLIIACVAAVLAIALIATLVVVFKKTNTPALAVITQYKIDEVTVGNVSTTVSGSGSLTPVTSKALKTAELLEELDEGTGGSSETPSQIPPAGVGGTVQTVNVQAGDTVEAGEVLAVIVFEAESSEAEEETRNILAPYNAVILEWYLKEGAEITNDTSVGMFLGTDDGYTMTISVDENNISLIELGQEVEISIDVSSEDMPTGAVTDISYNGSTSGSTTAYKITVTFDYVAGTYPGMSVSAEIVVEDSGEGLLVPVSAIQTSGDTKYVYLAPDGASLADVYEDGEIDVTKLTKVTVAEGMSDGSYTMVEGNLKEGDLIVVITRTSTQTGSDSSDGSGGMGGMGGFGGGGFPGGSMPDFGGEMPDFGSGFPSFGY